MTGTEWWKSEVPGCAYLYYVYGWPSVFTTARPANYILCKTDGSSWEPLYIGQTNDLSRLLDDHGAVPGTNYLGATHVHVHFNASQTARLAEEADLRRAYNALRSIQVR